MATRTLPRRRQFGRAARQLGRWGLVALRPSRERAWALITEVPRWFVVFAALAMIYLMGGFR